MNDSFTVRVRFLGLNPGRRSGGGDQVANEVGIPAGGSLIVVGACGSGKSKVASSLAGFARSGGPLVEAFFGGRPVRALLPFELARRVGLIPTNPALVFSCLSPTLLGEIRLSQQFLGETTRADSTIGALVERLELSHLVHRDPLTLSGGEKVRAALAVVLAKRPEVLVLDDVYSELDPDSRRRVRLALMAERETSGLRVVELHARCPRPEEVSESAAWLFLDGVMSCTGTFHECAGALLGRAPHLLPYLSKGSGAVSHQGPAYLDALGDRLAVETRDLSYRYPGTGGFRLLPVSERFGKGTITFLLGPNGAGKTTFLRCIGNLVTGWSGSIEHTSGRPRAQDPVHVWARSALYCFQNPDDQLFLPTVRDEIETTARYLCGEVEIAPKLQAITTGLNLANSLERSPHDLPRPLRRLTTVASGLVAAPASLLLDEPTAGLDRRQVQVLTPLLTEFVIAGGTLMVITHDEEFLDLLAGSQLRFSNGAVERALGPDQVSGNGGRG